MQNCLTLEIFRFGRQYCLPEKVSSTFFAPMADHIFGESQLRNIRKTTYGQQLNIEVCLGWFGGQFQRLVQEIYISLPKSWTVIRIYSYVTTSAQKLDIANCFSFYQDNGPKRKTVNVQLWLLYNCTHILQTPPQSADLNVVEHLYLEENLKNRSIFNMKDLKNSLKYE